jgi:hypothetical protein
MSTREQRHERVIRRIMPVRITVRQADGSYLIQIVDADIRQDKRDRKSVKQRHPQNEEL